MLAVSIGKPDLQAPLSLVSPDLLGMGSEKVSNEEVYRLRTIYEVLLRDAAAVYADIEKGIGATLYSAVLLTVMIGFMGFVQLTTYLTLPPVNLNQWIGHIGMIAGYFVLAYFAIRWYQRFFFMKKKYAELLRISKEVKNP